MKKRSANICLALCLALCLVLIPANSLTAQAGEVIATVSGTVQQETKADLLILSTSGGRMEIKLDSATDTSACKMLLPGRQINVSVSRESDGYLHAVTITSSAPVATASVDTGNTVVVSGTISDKSRDDLLYFNTQGGVMEIKLDGTTNLSGCKVLVLGRTYYITCARGSDAYMHAVSISDAAVPTGTGSVTSALSPMPAGVVTEPVTMVSGTVKRESKTDLLYLSTSGGVMEIKLDANTDSRNGMIAVPDRSLTATVYRGSDAYMHAATVTGVKNAVNPVSVDTASATTVTGTVSGNSTENMLYLNTSGGVMELKLDALLSASGFKVLVQDQKVTVTCARGADAYMHAVSITAN